MATPFLLFPSQFPLLTVAVLIFLIVTWLLEVVYGRAKTWVTPLNGVLLLLGITLCSAIFISADPEWTLPKATGLILGLAVWRFLAIYVKTAAQIKWLIIGYLFIGLGMLGLGVLGINWADKVPFLSTVLNRLPEQLIALPGSADGNVHANQLAGTLLLLWPFSLGLLFVNNFRPLWPFRIFVIILVVGELFLLLVTQSRAGWLGSLVGFASLLWFASFTIENQWRRVRWLLPIVGLVTGVTVILLFGWEQVLNMWLDPPDATVLGSFKSLGFRQEVWHWALTAIGDFPLTGTGLGTFRQVAFRLYPIAITPTYDIAHAHNIFLQVALDVGLFGLAAYIGLLAMALYMGWIVVQQNRQWRPVALGGMASLVALHTYGLLDALALGSKPGLLLWLLIAILTVLFKYQIVQATPIEPF